ncbi:M3 family metallopeptidase [Olivibacter domesticus]|uniref:Peptidyl-dipeptidase Dcp n=1 Tax=Olivibacter domesticus TaxID=407022 RepID=A0A1H7LPS8_OLID1|nr:M3 family metallopeptidase [Olivibacter domesticus]SEL00849.1 peptidyl-dipeptidase Dcp [Olivibacter domesticus]
MSNLLLKNFDTPFQSVPFEDIRQENFKPAILHGIEFAKNEIDQIVNNLAEPTFENTVVALEQVGKQLQVVTETFFNLNSAETNDYLQQLAQEVSPLLAEYGNDITLNEALFQRVKNVFENTEKDSLTIEEYRLLDKTYKSFTRNGALLTDVEKEKLRAIDMELSTLKVSFSQNVLQETNDYFLHLTDIAQLEGIPVSIATAAKEEALKRNLTGWVFTLQYPSFVPFMKYAANRQLRKDLYLASSRKAFQQNKYNNEKNVKDIVQLRQERAQLLGFESHADFVLQERMAGNPQNVDHFLHDLLAKAKPFALQEVDGLSLLAAKDGIDKMMPYDHAYYAEKWREDKFNFSDESLKPYFSLYQVLDAAFDAAHRLFGLTFSVREDIQKYHEEVTVYEVLENGVHKALLYTDWHPREGKRAGAWMTSYRGQSVVGGKNMRPHISIVCNFSRPSADTPSLLTFNEVTTLFHEFGHALHGIMANTVFESLSGTHVYWDFVELPSQFMENFCYDKDFLSTFAKHYKTGEILPLEEIDKIVASSNFMEGYQTLRQLSFGLLDMAYHTNRFSTMDSVEEFEKKIIEETQLYPTVEGSAMSPSFSHIFPGGYSAGYYSYKWAEVLDADAFDYFRETGIFNAETADKFKTLLSKGGTVDPMELYIDFRGRKPAVDALLKRAGLV